MKRNRKNAGFSMGELLVVVAILVILMGLGFVALIQYQRTLKQLELDGIAKEIFVAAQNHLTMADSQGLLEGKTDGTADAEKDVYYFVGG
jgi:prepilin-type N-terminal cleavage/methylation domain-containing protein